MLCPVAMELKKKTNSRDGVAMGSPVGPVLANIFMCDFEEKQLMNSKISPSV